ncbi:MAG: family 10 glycosylhydrolase [Planctomycetes bacterium]|nr:family 10 glycosylhydrolase [Planctomycetota bacterium]MCH9726187.1 family 10 glycosylhydrolase [Planctomycetota bacterium]MCH9775692.1 family 10 glycosylhydrolase [Planctomycetota bacterium]MCH9791344.1 family 10 glycosylhydrolase [Planctomycetota bacterium]
MFHQLPILFVLTVGFSSGTEIVLDDFNYASSSAVRKSWQELKGTLPLSVQQMNKKNALLLSAPFSSNRKIPRAGMDKSVKLDLSTPSLFIFDVKPESPNSNHRISLYFKSGPGWYSAASQVNGKDWQTLRFLKSDFRPEDKPVSWNKIEAIRLVVWRDSDAEPDTHFQFRHLKALTNEIAIIVPDLSLQKKEQDTFAAAERIEGFLQTGGIQCDRISETVLTSQTLGNRSVAILPFNPNISPKTCKTLNQFMQRGGKVFLNFHIPTALEKNLGIKKGKYFKPEKTGGLAAIRLKDSNIKGLPSMVKQASWNLVAASPTGHNAHIVGEWLDDKGKGTGKPALIVSDRGAYFSHLILGDDPIQKQELLTALMGHFQPSLWHSIAEATIEQAGQVGPFHTFTDLKQHIVSTVTPQKSRELAARDLDQTITSLQQAKRLLKQNEAFKSIPFARACREKRVKIYLLTRASPPQEARAFWDHSPTGPYPGDWNRTCKELSNAGFNMIIPNMLWGGLAHYPSDVLPRSQTYEKYGDQIEQCLKAAHQHGLEVHVWKVNHNLSTAPASFIKKMRDAGRTQVSVKGEPSDWLNPAHPENFQLEVDSMLEVVKKYPVDGIHFDYIRYPNDRHCYSDYSRKKFESDTGIKVTNWPGDCYNGKLKSQYRDWRAAQITRLVETVQREARKLRPGIKISAAVFREYPECREWVAQDWPLWAKRGYLDFICPMDYTDNDRQFQIWIEEQQKHLAGSIPIYPGIGALSARTTLSSDRVLGQIAITRQLKTGGFTVFSLNQQTLSSIVPDFKLSAGKVKATPTHRLKSQAIKNRQIKK